MCCQHCCWVLLSNGQCPSCNCSYVLLRVHPGTLGYLFKQMKTLRWSNIFRCASISCFQVVTKWVSEWVSNSYFFRSSVKQPLQLYSLCSLYSLFSLYILSSLFSLYSLCSLYNLNSLYSLYSLYILYSLTSFTSASSGRLSSIFVVNDHLMGNSLTITINNAIQSLRHDWSRPLVRASIR